MFCKYCGRQIKEGEECICRKPQNSDTVRMQTPGKTQPAQRKQPEERKQSAQRKQPEERKQPAQRRQPEERKQPAQRRQPEERKQPVQRRQPEERRQPKKEPKSSEGKKGLAVFSYVCTVLMLVSFILLRFVLQDSLGDLALYPYLMYIVPIIFGMIALLLAIFSLQDRNIRKMSLAAVLVSAILMAGIFVSMAVFPYEADSYSSSDDDDEDEDEDEDDADRDENTEDAQDAEGEEGEEIPSDSGLAEIKKDYEDGSADYVQVKNALIKLDMDAMGDEEGVAALELQETIEKDLEEEMKNLAGASDYKGIMEKLTNMRDAVENEDEFLSGLLEKYEPEYIMYLDTESKKLTEEGNEDAAIKMLEDAQELVQDKGVIMDMLMETQNAVGTGDYIIPDSDSRYLTTADISSLNIQQINYAKNEIYARHGRRFQSNELQTYFDSKSWYRGTIEPSAFNVNVLNSYEKKNAELLSSREFSMESGGYKLDVH